MKKTLIILFLIVVTNSIKAQTPPITDTLQWLKINIQQRSSFFSGKHFSVLLDSLYDLKASLQDYVSTNALFVPYQALEVGDSITANDIYSDHLIIYFEDLRSIRADSQFKAYLNSALNHTPVIKVAHIPKMVIKFEEKVALPKIFLKNRQYAFKWNPLVEAIYRNITINSVIIDEL